MAMSKSYPIFLLLIFLGLFGWIYQSENHQLQAEQQQELNNFKQYMVNFDQWQGNGSELYQRLSEHYPLQFFQYIDDTDGQLNYTQGELNVQMAHPLAGLFSLDLSHTQKLPAGRLQVKLSVNQAIENAIANTQQLGFSLLLAYIVLVVVFLLLINKLKSSIRYAADYIMHVPELSFSAIESSRLNG